MAVSRARRSTKSTVAGFVDRRAGVGLQTMVVTPPAAAAWLAEAKVSRWLGAGFADEGAHVDQARAPRSCRGN